MQSRIQSMLEAWANVAIGYVVALRMRLPTVCQAQTNYQGDMFTKEAL